MFVVCFCAGEFGLESGVDWQYFAPKVNYLAVIENGVRYELMVL